ncbi:MAG TPA: AbgT family transporter [Longimicrobiales bacterium]|nr:AbgT family transporter [Longimicrobiales bacterium]
MTEQAPSADTGAAPPQGSWTARFLSIIEKVGNALPHPGTLFAAMALLVVLLSWVAAQLDIMVIHPGTGDEIRPVNLLSVAGLHRILGQMVTNFTSFAPLGTVLVALLGIGVAEGSGLIGSALRLLVISAPKRLLTFVIVFAGVLSNTASEIGYVLLVPLAASIFLAAGRHPIAGLAAAFAGVSGGYSANVLLGTIDPLLAGLSEEAARIVDAGYTVSPAANYYFMAVSAFVIAVAGTWVTERIVVPRVGEYTGDEKPEELRDMNAEERRGLRWAFAAVLLLGFLLVWSALPLGSVPGAGWLRDPATGALLRSPFMSGIVALIFVVGTASGIAYGLGAGTYKSDAQVMKGMGKAMETLGLYMVIVFFASQFVAYFNWTNLGLIIAVEGSELLRASGLGPIPLLVAFVLLSASINLFMGSASAKWAIMAPVFVPMLMLLGYSPELTQVAYRIGDSSTNIISPMMSYFALIVAFLARWDPKAGIGTVIATMLPYTVVFLVVWTILLAVWVFLGIPVGPGSPLFIPVAQGG